ncbi:MAG: hypothetical protein J3K34DRAFT_417289 [Monoraphidium minutum]|nr:MAG: hypothetical protein J3K34DRAFT_417289 [Monoraphidium minutum]
MPKSAEPSSAQPRARLRARRCPHHPERPEARPTRPSVTPLAGAHTPPPGRAPCPAQRLPAAQFVTSSPPPRLAWMAHPSPSTAASPRVRRPNCATPGSEAAPAAPPAAAAAVAPGHRRVAAPAGRKPTRTLEKLTGTAFTKQMPPPSSRRLLHAPPAPPPIFRPASTEICPRIRPRASGAAPLCAAIDLRPLCVPIAPPLLASAPRPPYHECAPGPRSPAQSVCHPPRSPPAAARTNATRRFCEALTSGLVLQ